MIEDRPEAPAPEAPARARLWALALAAGIATYVGYVSYHAILNHYALGTAAYDLGIYENVFWNSIHGRWFASALELPGNHLGVHTTFVLVLFFPIYALFPATETLLVLQTVALGLAAWPLYLLARRALGSAAALAFGAIYLTHPAIGGANFDDFHALAFAPGLFFAVVWAWRAERRRLFWLFVVLLLSVREDVSPLVLLLGVSMWIGGERRRGAAVAATGAAAWVALEVGWLGAFGHPHDFTRYYSALIPSGGGLDPLFVARHVLSGDKLLYVFQIFAPLAFLCFLGLEGWLLTSYGLAMSLLASHEPLFHIGFHYPLILLPPAFVATILILERRSRSWRRRSLAAAGALALVTCYRYGMIYPRHDFMGGFRPVDFHYSESERERHRELVELVAMIPPAASVTASEILVPHVARRRQIETIRYALRRPGRRYDYYLVLRGLPVDRFERLPEVAGFEAYEPLRRGKYCDLLRRRSDS